ncbi:Ankyrin repeat protein 3 [Giardia muris]|uniref:Ankyrin repeat protein 3 n=1 Tax=Giardia muris TaxID=5742 RepID=A0A4Z1T3C2_GIAMU|nr:Ankyrin repeat protein 3 [Giardia muris]|eukprot:TNJ27557.1 Ankyrin repeat protein 3 [Giardia muris]
MASDVWFSALEAHDYEALRRLAAEHRGLRDEQGRTALMVAAEAGDEAAVTILLPYEALYVTTTGETALVLAARANRPLVCRLLAPRERSVLTPLGRDACIEAVLAESYDAFCVLCGTCGLVPDCDGLTSLDYAAIAEDDRFLRSFLTRANIPEDVVAHACQHAKSSGHTEAASLLEGYVPEHPGQGRLTLSMGGEKSSNASYRRDSCESLQRNSLIDRLSADGYVKFSPSTLAYLESVNKQLAELDIVKEKLTKERAKFAEEKDALVQDALQLQTTLERLRKEKAAPVARRNDGSYTKMIVRKTEASTYKALFDIVLQHLGPVLEAYDFDAKKMLAPLHGHIDDFDQAARAFKDSQESVENIVSHLIERGTVCLEDINGVFTTLVAAIPDAQHKPVVSPTIDFQMSRIDDGTSVLRPLSGRERLTTTPEESAPLIPKSTQTMTQPSTTDCDDCKVLRKEIDKLQTEVITLNSTKVLMEAQFSDDTRAHAQEQAKLQREIEQLRSRLKAQDDAALTQHVLNARISELEETLKSKAQAAEEAATDNEILRGRLDSLTSKCSMLEQQSRKSTEDSTFPVHRRDAHARESTDGTLFFSRISTAFDSTPRTEPAELQVALESPREVIITRSKSRIEGRSYSHCGRAMTSRPSLSLESEGKSFVEGDSALHNIQLSIQRLSMQYGCAPSKASSDKPETPMQHLNAIEEKLHQLGALHEYTEEAQNIMAALLLMGYIPAHLEGTDITTLVRGRALSKALSSLSSDLDKLRSKTNDLTEESEAVGREAAMLRRQLSEQTGGLASMEDALLALEDAVSQRDATISSLQAELLALEGRKEMANAADSNTSAELEHTQAQLQAAEEELQRLKRETGDKISGLEEEASNLRKQLRKPLTASIAVYTESPLGNDASAPVGTPLKFRTLSTSTSAGAGIDVADSSSSLLRSFIMEITSIMSSKAVAKGLTPQALQLFKNARGDEEYPKIMSTLFSELSTSALKANKALADMRREVLQIKEDYETVSETVAHKNIRIAALERELVAAEKNLKMTVDTDEYERRIEEVTARLRQLSSEQEAQAQTIKLLREQVVMKDEELTGMQASIDNLLREKSEVETEIQKCKQEQESARLQLEAAEQELARFQSLVQANDMELASLKSLTETHQSEIAQHSRNADMVSDEYQAKLQHLEARVLSVTKELHDAQSDLQGKAEEITRLEVRLREQKASLARKASDITHASTNSLQILQQNLEFKLDQALDDLAYKSAECVRKTAKITALEEEVTDLTRKLEESRRLVAAAPANAGEDFLRKDYLIRATLASFHAGVLDSFSTINSAITKNTRKLSSFVFTVHDLSQKIEGLKRSLRAKERALREAQQKQQHMASQHTCEANVTANLLSQIDTLKQFHGDELKRRDEELETLRARLIGAQEEVSELRELLRREKLDTIGAIKDRLRDTLLSTVRISTGSMLTESALEPPAVTIVAPLDRGDEKGQDEGNGLIPDASY